MFNKKNDVLVSLQGVTKKYSTANCNTYIALNNINLEITRGERIGIVGNNGAGKTTLLKIIGGITKPSQGKVTTYAKIVSLIDLEAGFEPELSGIENIIVNGLIIGMKKQEIKKNIQSIINFADIGPYIYEPFYTYSAGMKFRLACALAINSQADVLLFDEILSSSDWGFQQKIFKMLTKTLKNKQLTTVICSYVPETLWSLASKFYLMQKGVIKEIQKNQVRHLAVTHIQQFHQTFRTREIEKIAVGMTKSINFNTALDNK